MVNCFKVIILVLPWLAESLERSESYKPNSFITQRQSRYVETPKSSLPKHVPRGLFEWNDDEFSDEKFSASAEVSKESNAAFRSTKNGDGEYTISTDIHVRHPSSASKKPALPLAKAVKPTKHAADHRHGVEKEARTLQQNDSAKLHTNIHSQLAERLEPNRIVLPSTSVGSSYNVYEADQEDFQAPKRSRTSLLLDQFQSVASKKQIETYLEDQQKLLDEALKLQLLKDPRFQQYVKAKKKRLNEQFDSDEQQFSPNAGRPFHAHHDKVKKNGNHLRRPSQKSEVKRPVKLSPQVKNKGPMSRRFRSAIVINV